MELAVILKSKGEIYCNNMLYLAQYINSIILIINTIITIINTVSIEKIIMRMLQSYVHPVYFTLTAQVGPATFQGLKNLMWQVATGWTM